MKKLTLITLLFISFLSANAQMSLVKTFPSENAIDSCKTNFILVTESDPSSKICNYATRYKSIITIYNLDYSIYKTVTIPQITPVNTTLITGSETVKYMSKKLFNVDDKIEFLVSSIFHNTTSGDVINITNLIDEDGTILQSLPDMALPRLVITSSNQYNLLLSEVTGYIPSTYYTLKNIHIYALDNTYTQSLKSIKTSAVDTPYPNPAQTTITLPYTIAQGTTASLKIYSINGALIDEKKIDSYFSSILLNVNSYAPGTYIYEYNGISNKFTVN